MRREQKLIYLDAGYSRLGKLLADDDLARILVWLQAREDEGKSIDPGYEAEFEPRQLGSQLRLRKLRRLLWNDRSFWEPILKHTSIIEAGKDFVQSNACIIFHAAFMKPSFVGTPIAFHQDQALWRHQYPEAVSIWIALSPVTTRNGCLQVFPGSHDRGLIPHHTCSEYPWHPSIESEELELSTLEQLEFEPGEAVIWHRYLIHGSGPNLSATDRRGFVVVFADPNANGFSATDSYLV
jgi:hypothetical protein